jgi:hypothetical protein
MVNRAGELETYGERFLLVHLPYKPSFSLKAQESLKWLLIHSGPLSQSSLVDEET